MVSPDVPAPRAERILVVDDHAANRALAQAILEEEGYVTLTAVSGQEALDSFVTGAPDCLLLDVRMPGLDGFAVCTRIRALPGGSDTPIVFLTAARDVETFDRALMVGGDDFLTKPVRASELITRVKTALRLRRLSTERRELYAELRRQRDALTRLQLQKEQLTSFLVHDLKNPVATMNLHAQLLLRDREINQRSRNAALHIQAGTRHLMTMLLNLLDISKSEEDLLQVVRAPVDLAELARRVVGEMEVIASAAEVRLRVLGEVPPFSADADLLQRALANLIENAIRHAPPDSEVSVSLCSRPGGVEIRVADAGKGVPPEWREQIFDRFVQLKTDDGTTASRSGRGLGLAFCKVVAVAHGGRIWVEDAAPGAVFCLEMPHER